MHTCFIPPMVVVVVIQSAVKWHLQTHIYPSAKCTQSCIHPLPLHVTWSLHPSLVDTHGRSCSFPFIHPREVFPAWCWVIARPLSPYGVVSLSLPLEVGLTGMGLVHLSHAGQTPTHRRMPVSDARGEVSCGVGHVTVCTSLVTLYEGTSVAIWHTTSWGLSSHLSLIFLFPW